ncbi:MAG: hypothetical protein SFX74_08680 [Fimbriimonadaceae bacterium]|nr:hypothetical protein [Fimbriimonadaceae bacterium]
MATEDFCARLHRSREWILVADAQVCRVALAKSSSIVVDEFGIYDVGLISVSRPNELFSFSHDEPAIFRRVKLVNFALPGEFCTVDWP